MDRDAAKRKIIEIMTMAGGPAALPEEACAGGVTRGCPAPCLPAQTIVVKRLIVRGNLYVCAALPAE